MSELKTLWTKYKTFEQSGNRSDGAKKIEAQIHEIQKQIGSSAYDFDARWGRAERDGKPSIELPSLEAEPVEHAPQANFTLPQAEKMVGENDTALLRDAVRWVEPRMIILADEANKVNPDNSNVARRGQVINLSLAKFKEDKENG